MKKRVVLTGAGVVSPIGQNVDDLWTSIVEGRCAADRIRRFNSAQYPSVMGYEVDPSKVSDSLKNGEFGEFAGLAADSLPMGRYAFLAAAQALSSAKWESIPAEKTGISLGVGMGCPDVDWYRDNFVTGKVSDKVAREHVRYMPHTITDVIAERLKLGGEVTTVHTACASSGQAIGEAFEAVRNGDAVAMLTGGCDSMIHPFYVAGFCLLGALSKRSDKSACRPFDAKRDGFVLGEGACVLVLEEYEHAVARGADIIAEVVGYGVTESAYRITDLHPDGEGPIEAMQAAVDDADIARDKVQYINAHGTSTLLNDQIESLAIQKVFGNSGVYVSSSKSMTGHLISAAGAIELLICALALRHQTLPPSVNLEEPDPACPVRLTPVKATAAKLDYALSNSVGFGGSNTAIVARRFQ
jgi:3-oxoacyl-[acyl-carrier-protein] synthase II